MKGFKEQSVTERLDRAAKAKQALMEKFKARPKEDDPEVIAKKEARAAVVKAREERELQRAEAKRLEEIRLAEEAARLEEEKRLEAELQAQRDAELKLQQKADRDARYAARKARR